MDIAFGNTIYPLPSLTIPLDNICMNCNIYIDWNRFLCTGTFSIKESLQHRKTRNISFQMASFEKFQTAVNWELVDGIPNVLLSGNFRILKKMHMLSLLRNNLWSLRSSYESKFIGKLCIHIIITSCIAHFNLWPLFPGSIVELIEITYFQVWEFSRQKIKEKNSINYSPVTSYNVSNGQFRPE